MKYLVDASVLSEPTKSQPTRSVLEWPAKHDAHLLVNPIILGELEYGIQLLPRGKRTAGFRQAELPPSDCRLQTG